MNTPDFVDELEAMLDDANTCLQSAMMSDDFLSAVDELLGEIRNREDQQDLDGNTSNTA
jgi:hypothetical protein